MRKTIKKQFTFGNLLSVIAIVVSVIAILLNNITENKANRLIETVNSKEYEISENLKYELLKVVADLKSIESKAVFEPLTTLEMDYSKEAEAISKLRTSPGYLILMHSIEDEDDRMMLDANLLMLSGSINDLPIDYKRSFSHNALEYLKNKTNINKSISMKIGDLMVELCDMKIIAPEYEKHETAFESFLNYMVKEKKTDDKDILMFYSAIENDTTMLVKALNAGANPMITARDIIERYQEDFDEFMKKQLNQNEH